MGCCNVARQVPDLTPEEDSCIKRTMSGNPWDVAELLSFAEAGVPTSGFFVIDSTNIICPYDSLAATVRGYVCYCELG